MDQLSRREFIQTAFALGGIGRDGRGERQTFYDNLARTT